MKDSKQLKISNENLNFILLSFGIGISFFDSHIEKLTNIKNLPLPEIYIILLVIFCVVKNSLSCSNLRVAKFSFYISILFILSLFSGLVVNNIFIITTIMGSIWLFKSLFSYYLGFNLEINEQQKARIITFLYAISLVSLVFTWVQIIFRGFNPFQFNLASSGIIGFMDNPNKNGFILLIGFLYVSICKKKYYQILSFFFLVGIFFVQSRQILIILFLILFYYYFIIKRNYLIVLSIGVSLILGIVLFKDTLFYRFTREIPRIINTANYFRLKALKKSLLALGDNLFFGTGPGTFGGFIAHFTDSDVHKKYDLFEHWSSYTDLSKIPMTIDMYWPHLIVEIGILGTLLTIVLYHHLYVKLKRRTTKTSILIRLFFIITILMGFFSMSLEASYISIPIFILVGVETKLCQYEGGETY